MDIRSRITTGYTSLAVVPPDSITEGYAFVRLKNTREYTQAGEKLHNCLRSYMPPLVYVIKKTSAI